MYTINIIPEPEIFNGKEMYFWMIQSEIAGTQCNCGHGWSESVPKAAEDANKYYQNVFKKAVEENGR
jgi:hypothetical protein